MTRVPDHLFSPLSQRSVTFPNRIAVSPMCQYSYMDGLSNDWQFVHLGSRAVGGAGIVFTEAAAVNPEGRITPGDLGLWSEAHIAPLARIASFVKDQGSVPGIQLAHAGRKASMARPWETPLEAVSIAKGGWQPVGPTTDPFSPSYPTPAALDRAGMDKVIEDFAATTRRAVSAGFLLAEVHCAHGYLLHEFLSPLSNRRTDEYGGSLENRARFPLEVIRAVRASFPSELPVWVRLSVTDWVDPSAESPTGGLTVDDSVAFAKLVKAEGIDLVDCSSGGNDPRQQIPVGAGYQVAFAERIRREADIQTGAVGMITAPEQADQIVRTGQADVVLLARELLRDPYWPLHAAEILHKPGLWPVQYERAAHGKVERRQPLPPFSPKSGEQSR
ncbi:MAG: NADH:flavin oxidoreductase/NADH oxidase [Edaphobacter sp.]|uniref:NADH:flavin oxidoreductase/NADH oxidase n=1 Tax=Edaphobacter sp. TaxID=1934404 RepID=UPI002389D547|nr:NADH:flavin oxidoreductase/NADH oxidase [Edaphobacter sp.]MDE1178021.1 NADH:flavin oxidoreductase/NADH oxidase [Edaphobacter sp.]